MAERPFVVIDVEQRSEVWRQMRSGRLTASRAKDMLASVASGEAAGRRNLRVQLIVERLTGIPQSNGYVNEAMQWGIEHEAEAIAEYELRTDHLVRTVGFLAHRGLAIGCSPDGVIGDFEGLVEVKSPHVSAVHWETVRAGVIPSGHLPQLRHALLVTEPAEWVDFVSYDPRFPEHLQFFLSRLRRMDADIEGYRRKVMAFLAEVDAEVAGARGVHVFTEA
jgi:YqaJ-like viral recombinase domain